VEDGDHPKVVGVKNKWGWKEWRQEIVKRFKPRIQNV